MQSAKIEGKSAAFFRSEPASTIFKLASREAGERSIFRTYFVLTQAKG